MIALDTDVVSLLMRPRPPAALLERLASTPLEDQATTAITVGELAFGAAKAGRPVLLDRALGLLSGVRILAFERAAALSYGDVRAELEGGGRPLADPDLRIAAIVLAHDATLVTANIRHFARVPGLRVEDWTVSGAGREGERGQS